MSATVAERVLTDQNEAPDRAAPLCLTAARHYLGLGLRAFPIKGKDAPCIAWKALQNSPPTATDLASWWHQWPGANVALLTGLPGGVWVLDVDAEAGPEWLDRTDLAAGLLVRTPGGGLHAYYQTIPGLRNSAGKLARSVDVRAEGGVIVAPPSSRDGKPYAVVSGSIEDALRTPAPEWLLDMVASLVKPAHASKTADAAGAVTIPESQRNDTLYRDGCAMRCRGMGEPEILAALTTENATRCAPPLDAEEVASILASVVKHDPGAPSAGNAREDQVERLTRYLSEATLIHGPDNLALARVPGGRPMAINVRGGALRPWLVQRHMRDTGKPPTSEALVRVLEGAFSQALALPQQAASLRVAEGGGCVYLDLGEPDTTRAVEISPDGWRVVTAPPVLFLLDASINRPLPEPAAEGTVRDLARLRPLFALPEEELFLVACWKLGTLQPGRPYPILGFIGPAGSFKSTRTKLCRFNVDPAGVGGRLTGTMPRKAADLFSLLKPTHVGCLDNVSSLAGWCSDILSATATGTAWITRRLYSDNDAAILELLRPVIVNGIAPGGILTDLLDRAIIIPVSAPATLRDEEAIWREAEEARPYILAGLSEAAAAALRGRARVAASLPRMADFARWCKAAEPALRTVPGWERMDFLALYRQNRQDASGELLESDLIGKLVVRLASDGGWPAGTASDLLADLARMVEADYGEQAERILSSRRWPKNAKALSGHLDRIDPQLRARGILIERGREARTRRRLLTIAERAE